MVKHLVTLIENEDADASKAQDLITDKRVQTARRSYDDVRAGILVLDNLDILLDGGTTVEHASLDVRHVLAEPVVLVSDLERELTGVAHNQDRDLAVDGLDLLERGQDKDGCLSETRLGLRDDVASEERLGDTGLLNCGPIDVRLFPANINKTRSDRKVRPSVQRVRRPGKGSSSEPVDKTKRR